MLYDYAVRITHSYDVAKAIVELWALRCEKMLVYEHVGSITEKVHIHLIIERSDTGKKWLRQLGARTGVNLTGNKYCSFKEYDGNKTAIVYMTKGIHDPKYNKGYSEEDLALWKSQWEEHPKSKDEKLYNNVFGDEDYNSQLYAEYCGSHPKEKTNFDHKFQWVKKVAYNSSLMRNGFIVNHKTINEYKMLVYSYCARNDIRVPDNDPAFKRLV